MNRRNFFKRLAVAAGAVTGIGYLSKIISESNIDAHATEWYSFHGFHYSEDEIVDFENGWLQVPADSETAKFLNGHPRIASQWQDQPIEQKGESYLYTYTPQDGARLINQRTGKRIW